MPTGRKKSEKPSDPGHTTVRLSYASRERLKALMARHEHLMKAQKELGLSMFEWHPWSVDEFIELCLVEMEPLFRRWEARVWKERLRQEAEAEFARRAEKG